MAVVRGMMKIVLYDAREGSPTRGEVNQFFAGEHNAVLIHIPPYVYHGFKCISPLEAIVVNVPDRVYRYDDPDEFRVPPHDGDIPYDWDRKDG
jgi:dTDP-4-dehydrorhamnose 3,5-epimerase